jgi:hypothetical protein
MEENLHKDNLEEFFKNSFNEENIGPPDDQWDVPSDDVWSGINKTINPTSAPAAPFTFNLKWFMAAAASILILGLVYYNYTLQKQISNLTEVIENQENTIDKLEKMVLEKGQMEEGNNGVKSEGESNLVENGKKEKSGNIEEFSSVLLQNNTSKTFDESSQQDDSGVTSNQNYSQKSTSNQQNGVKGKSINNSQSINPSIDKSTIKKDIAKRDQKVEASSVAVVKENASLENVKSEGSISKQENQNNIGLNPSGLQENTIVILTPLSSKIIFAEANSPSKDITLDMLPVSEEVFKPSTSSITRTGFYVGAHIAPTYGYRNIKSVDGPVLRRLLIQQEKAIYSVSLGMKAGYQFSKNWSVETGLNYYKNTVQSMHRAQVRYESQIERLNSDGSYDSNYHLRLSTSYGEIETDVALTRSSDVQIDQNEYINLVLKTQQELKNLGIPIAVRYRTAGNKFHFSAKAGFSANFTLQKDVTVKAAAVTRNGVKHRRTIIDKQFSGLKTTTFDVLFGIGLDYDISKNLSIYFEPTAMHSINPVYNLNGKIKTYPIVASLNIGLAYRF